MEKFQPLKPKKMKNITHIFAALLLAAVLILPFATQAQDAAEKIDPSFSFAYKKESDGTRTFTGNVKYRKEKVWTPLSGVPVDFYVLKEGEEVQLVDAISNEKGVFMAKVDGKFPLPMNAEGNYEFLARTRETNEVNSTEESIVIKDIQLEIVLNQEDEVRQVIVKGTTIDPSGTVTPLSGTDIKLFVPRMFTYLSVGEATLEEGTCTIEFPNNIVGNRLGELDIIASVVENEEFGTVEKAEKSTWGLISPAHLVDHPSRELWTPVAPLWMIITLIVMLVGVWGHYIYTVIMLILIRKEGKSIEAQNLK